MARVKLVSTTYLIFKRIFNRFGNILPQNKDTEADSVQKISLIYLVLKNFVTKKL